MMLNRRNSNAVMLGDRLLKPSNRGNRERLGNLVGIGKPMEQTRPTRFAPNYGLDISVRNRAKALNNQRIAAGAAAAFARGPSMGTSSFGGSPSPSMVAPSMGAPSFGGLPPPMPQGRPLSGPPTNARAAEQRRREITNVRFQMSNKLRNVKSKQGRNSQSLAQARNNKKKAMDAAMKRVNNTYNPTIQKLSKNIQNGNTTVRSIQKQMNNLGKSKNLVQAKSQVKSALKGSSRSYIPTQPRTGVRGVQNKARDWWYGRRK